ncbi:hypothetical protein MRX96_045112 [Rhipicephalus microplus]
MVRDPALPLLDTMLD